MRILRRRALSSRGDTAGCESMVSAPAAGARALVAAALVLEAAVEAAVEAPACRRWPHPRRRGQYPDRIDACKIQARGAAALGAYSSRCRCTLVSRVERSVSITPPSECRAVVARIVTRKEWAVRLIVRAVLVAIFGGAARRSSLAGS